MTIKSLCNGCNTRCFASDCVRANKPKHRTLGLFEAGTARTFCDLSYPWITLDASRVIWICTSNNADSLSAPILDRVRRFDIPDLTERQARAVLLQIYDDLIQSMPGITSAIRLPRTSVDVLMHVSPRRMRQALREGIGRALVRRCGLRSDAELLPKVWCGLACQMLQDGIKLLQFGSQH